MFFSASALLNTPRIRLRLHTRAYEQELWRHNTPLSNPIAFKLSSKCNAIKTWMFSRNRKSICIFFEQSCFQTSGYEIMTTIAECRILANFLLEHVQNWRNLARVQNALWSSENHTIAKGWRTIAKHATLDYNRNLAPKSLRLSVLWWYWFKNLCQTCVQMLARRNDQHCCTQNVLRRYN